MTTEEINRELTHASWRAVRPLFLALVLVFVCIWAALAEAATVTIDTAAYQINLGTRNKIYFSRIGSVPLGTACIDAMPALDAFVIADRMKVTLAAGRTSRPNQIFAKCGTPPPPPPVASLQVYACADAGADGRILESATISWPNCATASYQNPSKTLVVAVNTGALPHYWHDVSDLTTEKIWVEKDGVGAWVAANTINWWTAPSPPPPPPPPAGTANLRWTPSTENIDGTTLTNLAGYRILYGLQPSEMTRTVTVPANRTSYVIDGLTPATWFFSILAFNSLGAEGFQSNTATVVIR